MKVSLTVEKFLDQGKFPWLLKIYFLDCRKKKGLKILKKNTSAETIKTYLLSLEQKLSLFTFFAVDKISIVFCERIKHKY